jgi:uncharacterized protein (UPF0548 family)
LFRVSKPDRAAIDSYLAAQGTAKFSYSEVGRSREGVAALDRYNVDHNRIQLGTGRGAFERAKIALRSWKMFEMPWLEICWPTAPIDVGTNVAALAIHLGFWSLNPCRIVYTLDETSGAAERFGFAYGTLRGHSEIGEERFTVEYYPADEAVWYDLYAFSRPGLVARAGAPFARALQRRFALDSKTAMLTAVQLP